VPHPWFCLRNPCDLEKEVNQKGGYLHNKWLDLVLEIINVSLYDNKPKQKEL